MRLSKALGALAFALVASSLVATASPAADLVMWERSGGNKDMVDKLIEMWNAKYPDRHITLTYIPHAEMVAKLAQAIASGDVPDLMGMDLIYAPQFEKAGHHPNKPPTSLAELRADADKITALGGDIKGYYLPGSCAGCNIFTVGPLMWASGAKIETAGPGDEPLVGDGVKQVLQFARDLIKAGDVHESDRAETGNTFHLQFGSGKVGMMGTGN